MILTAVFWVIGFLRMGTTGLTSQAVGPGDGAEGAALLSRAPMIGLGAGGLLIAAQGAVVRAGFRAAPASAEVEALARDYIEIRIWSAPAAIALYGVTGWLIAQERTRAVLAVQLWMNGLNVGLDLWFELGLGWGEQGVALGTVMADWTGLGLGLWLCRGALAGRAWRDPKQVFDWDRLRRMVGVTGDILIRSVLLQAILVSFLFWGAGLGDVQLAANQVLMQFQNITAYAQEGFSFAAEAIVGQAFGARARAALRRGALLTGLWGGVVSLGLAVGFGLFGGALIDVMTTSEPVRAAAWTYLPWMVVSPLIAVVPWMLGGVFIGATRTRDMRNMMALSALGYFAAAGPLMAAFDNHGLWQAMVLSFVLRGVTLGLRYPALERASEPKGGRGGGAAPRLRRPPGYFWRDEDQSQRSRSVPMASRTVACPSRFSRPSRPVAMSRARLIPA